MTPPPPSTKALLKRLSDAQATRLLQSLEDEAQRLDKHEWSEVAQLMRQLARDLAEERKHPTGEVTYHLIDEDGEFDEDMGCHTFREAAIDDAEDRNARREASCLALYSVCGIYVVASCPRRTQEERGADGTSRG